MKKTLIITTNSGEVIERDLRTDLQAPFGAGANHEYYANLCKFIAINGMPSEGDNLHLNYLPPSQIKSVVVVFENASTQNVIDINK